MLLYPRQNTTEIMQKWIIPYDNTMLFIPNIEHKYFIKKIVFVKKKNISCNIRNKTHPQREQPPQSCKSKITTKTCDSAIGQHLLENPDCAKNHNGDMFRIIGKARSSFHLAVLESIDICRKNPLLFRQKEFVFTLGLHW